MPDSLRVCPTLLVDNSPNACCNGLGKRRHQKSLQLTVSHHTSSNRPQNSQFEAGSRAMQKNLADRQDSIYNCPTLRSHAFKRKIRRVEGFCPSAKAASSSLLFSH